MDNVPKLYICTLVRCTEQVAQYLHLRRYLCWKLNTRIAARDLLQEWHQLREDIIMDCWQLLHVSVELVAEQDLMCNIALLVYCAHRVYPAAQPKHWLNVLCPSKRVRRTISRITGLQLNTRCVSYHEHLT